MREPTVYFTSDTHFSHKNIIEYCGRPFTDVEHMNAALVDAWNHTVSPDDTVYHLGDIALGGIPKTLEIIRQLNGHKILIPGNHDKCWRWPKRKPITESKLLFAEEMYLDAGFEEILKPTTETHDGYLLPAAKLQLDVTPQTVLLAHLPPSGDHSEIDRYSSVRPAQFSGWVLHGHVHGLWRQRHRFINVGVDAWGGRPVSTAKIQTLIDAGPNDLEPIVLEQSAELTHD